MKKLLIMLTVLIMICPLLGQAAEILQQKSEHKEAVHDLVYLKLWNTLHIAIFEFIRIRAEALPISQRTQTSKPVDWTNYGGRLAQSREQFETALNKVSEASPPRDLDGPHTQILFLYGQMLSVMARITNAAKQGDSAHVDNAWSDLDVIWREIGVVLSRANPSHVVTQWNEVQGKIVWAGRRNESHPVRLTEDKSPADILVFGTFNLEKLGSAKPQKKVTGQAEEIDRNNMDGVIADSLTTITDALIESETTGKSAQTPTSGARKSEASVGTPSMWIELTGRPEGTIEALGKEQAGALEKNKMRKDLNREMTQHWLINGSTLPLKP